MVVLVTGGLFFDLPLPLAVVGHEGGTVLVVLNGLRLLSDPIRRAATGSVNLPSEGELPPEPVKPIARHEASERMG